MRFVLMVLLVGLAGCAGMIKKESIRSVDTDLQFYEYNDVYSSYKPRPTFVKVGERSGSGQILVADVESYGGGRTFYFPQEDAGDVIKYINKFAEWHSEAQKHGDQLDKEIGQVSGWSSFIHKYGFFSGQKGSHYLVLEQCVMTCGAGNGDRVYMPLEQAKTLKGLLQAMRSGEIEGSGPSGDYE